MTLQEKYVANWHDSFVGYIGSLITLCEGLMARPEATDDDREALSNIKMMLTGRDAADVERDLASGIVRRSMLDKLEKLNKDMANMCLEHIRMDSLVREFWKQMAHLKVEQDKRAEEMRLEMLRIPVVEG